MAAAAAIFGNDNYVFWEVPLPRFQKLGGVMGKIFWEKNVFRSKIGAVYAESATKVWLAT